MANQNLGKVLQHYGVKGMKWDVIRTEEQLAAARANAQNVAESAGAASEGLIDDITDSLGELFEDVGEKVSDIADDVKKKGKGLLSALSKKIDATFVTPKERVAMINKAFKDLNNASKGLDKALTKVNTNNTNHIRRQSNSQDSDDVKLRKRVERSRKANSANDIRRTRASNADRDDVALGKRVDRARYGTAMNDIRRAL